jgi:hypothetical protein
MMGLLMEGVRGNNSSTTANPTMMQLDMKHVSGELLYSFAYATLLSIIRLGFHSCNSHFTCITWLPSIYPTGPIRHGPRQPVDQDGYSPDIPGLHAFRLDRVGCDEHVNTFRQCSL